MFSSYHFFFELSMTNCRKHPIFQRKRSIHFWRKMAPSPKKLSCPQKLFLRYFFFSSKKNDKLKIFRSSFLTKKIFVFCCRIPRSPQTGYVLPQMVFRRFFRKYCFFWKTCVIIKYLVLIPDKKGFINFLCKTPLSLKNGQMSPKQFFVVSRKYYFFQKKLFNMKILSI